MSWSACLVMLIFVCSLVCFVSSINFLIALFISLISGLIVLLFCVICMCRGCLRDAMSLSVSVASRGCVLIGDLCFGVDSAMAACVCE